MSASSGANRPIPNSYWVVPGRFAAGEYPGAKDPDEAVEKLKTLLDARIDHFVDLTTESKEIVSLEPYREIAEDAGRRLGVAVGWERHPIFDVSVPSSPEEMARILDAIDSAMSEGKTVYVHCWGGTGRTGTVVGCWLVRHGSTGDEALRQIAEWWKGVEKVWRVPASPETPTQREYVRNWTEPSPKGEVPT